MCRPNTKRTEISPTKLCECELFGATEHSFWEAAIAQWLEHQARDLKVPGSSPSRNGGRIFFSRVNFLCWLLFWYPFYPCVTAVACKRSQSFCRLQLNTHTPYLYGFEWSDTVTWCMVEWCTQNLRWNGSISRGTSHATTTEHYQYTTSVNINNTHYKRMHSFRITCQCMQWVCLRAEDSAIWKLWIIMLPPVLASSFLHPPPFCIQRLRSGLWTCC